jgi:hypothetical protein
VQLNNMLGLVALDVLGGGRARHIYG